MHSARAKILITGRVQGVFYRHSTKQKAEALGLGGWVRNLPDGSVEIEAEGPKDKIGSLIAWCRHGPPNAVVDGVAIEWHDEVAARSDTAGSVTSSPRCYPSRNQFEIR
jgi:acylphosphatase